MQLSEIFALFGAEVFPGLITLTDFLSLFRAEVLPTVQSLEDLAFLLLIQ